MFFAFTFVFSSCSLQEQEISEKLTPTTEIKALNQSQGTDDADLMRIPPTRGCNCSVKVLSAENVNWVDGVEAGKWAVLNAYPLPPSGGGLEINGRGLTDWKINTTDPWQPLPSDYFELNYPSSGSHMFYLVALAELSSSVDYDFTVNLRVKCIEEQANGSLSYQVYYPVLEWKNGGNIEGTSGVWYTSFWFDFDC